VTDLRFGSIAEARSALDRREIGAIELTRVHLDAIAAENPRLNAFIAVTADQALDAAAAADRAIRAGQAGPLTGIPLSVKDLLDLQGSPTTAGGIAGDLTVATVDSAVVAKLREAGAVLLGKTNLHEYAFGTTSENPHFGPARNPHDETRVAGGSSGGSAAAVAAGLGYASIGTDSGGSVRIPAALCGVAGFKPTFGLVSRRGIVPLGWTADHAGPIARTVHDCALVLDEIAGFDPSDPGSVDRPVGGSFAAALEGGLAGVRIGLVRGASRWTEPEIETRLDPAAEVLRGLGAEVVDLSLDSLADGVACVAILLRVEAAIVHRERLAKAAHQLGADVRARLRAGQLLPATAYVDALRLRRALSIELDALLSTVDLLLLPTTPIVAPRIGETFDRVDSRGPNRRTLLSSLTALFNVTGVPAISVPFGSGRNGLPVGVQLAGRRWEDALVLRAGSLVQRAVS
jgi:aspartyl-tRNA(Asn)/glutamyl-tRNA(Gln) amidotransferase subunit A